MAECLDPEGRRLPIKLDTTSNGEFMPGALGTPAWYANVLAQRRAAATAKRLGLSRRAFLKSACGAAATLLAMNDAFARLGQVGGHFAVAPEAAWETSLAQATLSGNEFIFDVQGHHVNPQGAWRSLFNRWTYILRFFPQSDCGDGAIECFSAEHFIREVFLDSDTDMAVLSAVPAAPEANPLSTAEAAATRAMVEAMEGNHRLLIHGLVHPNLPGALDLMAQQHEDHHVAAWKTYTQWGPDGEGYWLDDPRYGIPFIERARELGSTWRMVMQDPDQAAHLLGKLFRYVGEDRVLWDTDSIWYGSPQDQIQAFRTFQISEAYQEQYGYPAITPKLRVKVFGLNATQPYGIKPQEIHQRTVADRVSRVKQAYLETPEPSFTTNGPKTRREFLQLYRLHGGRP